MAQLRDSKTSELIANGSVADLTIVADELGDAVLWDDVPPALDLEAVRQANAEQLAQMTAEDAKTERSRRAKIAKAAREVRGVAKSAAANGETLPPVEIG